MPEPLDTRLSDHTALEEIELTGDLIIAASQSTERLEQQEVDAILGIA